MLLFKKVLIIIQLKLSHTKFLVLFPDIKLKLPMGPKASDIMLRLAMRDVMVTYHHLLMASSSSVSNPLGDIFICLLTCFYTSRSSSIDLQLNMTSELTYLVARM